MHQKKKQWTSEEIQLLQTIKRTHRQKKWKLISKNLAKKGFKRTQHECRHKWVNCLNPQINHGPWTEQELRTLYSQYEKNHSQWSVIQKALPNRTQIRIKNHFYGVLRNIMRFILKYFKKVPGKESSISNKINPNSLQLMYRGQGQYSFMQNHIKNAIFSMEYHFEKQRLLKILEKNREIYAQLNDKLLEQASRIVISDQVGSSLINDQQLQGKKNNTEFTLQNIHPEKVQHTTVKYEIPLADQNAWQMMPNIEPNHKLLPSNVFPQQGSFSLFQNNPGILFYIPQYSQSYPLNNFMAADNLFLNFHINK